MSNSNMDSEIPDPLEECGARWKSLRNACQVHAHALDLSQKEIHAIRQAELSRHQLEMNRIESEREQYSAQCERILKHAQDQAVATAESQLRNAEDQARVQQEEIQNKFKDNSQSAKQHLEEAIWMADSVLETGESAPRVEFEEARTRIAQMQITLNESFEAACFQLKRYRQSQPAPQTIDGNLAPKSCEGILSMQAAVAMDSLARFRKLKLAGLFRGPILLVPSIMVTGTLTGVAALAGIRGAALLAAVGAGILLSVVGIMVLWLLARKQVRHAWIPISKARQVGLLAGEIAMQAAVEHRRATTAAALATRDHEVKLAKAKWAPILDDLLAKSRVILEEVKQARNSKKVEIENQKAKLLQRALEVAQATRQQVTSAAMSAEALEKKTTLENKSKCDALEEARANDRR
ncbi:MAG: hypothetical protein WCQ03_08150, partial [Phycisphaerae bacterium]